MVLVFSIERFLTISAANGKGSVEGFVRKIKSLLASNNIKEAKTQEDFNLLIKNNVGECSEEVLVLFYSLLKKTDLA
jgi:biopolymer transport protein ExbB